MDKKDQETVDGIIARYEDSISNQKEIINRMLGKQVRVHHLVRNAVDSQNKNVAWDAIFDVLGVLAETKAETNYELLVEALTDRFIEIAPNYGIDPEEVFKSSPGGFSRVDFIKVLVRDLLGGVS